MNQGVKMKNSLYILPVIAALLVSAVYDQAKNTGNQLCKHEFALCTSALCVTQPGDPTKAICFCVVKEGMSMSTEPCDKLKPSTDANGIRTIYSTFSLDQFNEGKKGMKCPSGTPWTWCLNKRCTVDSSDSKKAICVCDVMRTEEWMTLGGDCKTSTCKTGYWFGAAMSDFNAGNVFLTKALGLKESPVKWCRSTP